MLFRSRPSLPGLPAPAQLRQATLSARALSPHELWLWQRLIGAEGAAYLNSSNMTIREYTILIPCPHRAIRTTSALTWLARLSILPTPSPSLSLHSKMLAVFCSCGNVPHPHSEPMFPPSRGKILLARILLTLIYVAKRKPTLAVMPPTHVNTARPARLLATLPPL